MPRSCSARRNRHRIVSRGVTASFISTLEWWFAFPHPPGIYYHATYSGSRDRLLVAMAVSFPRPVFLEDVALIVSLHHRQWNNFPSHRWRGHVLSPPADPLSRRHVILAPRCTLVSNFQASFARSPRGVGKTRRSGSTRAIPPEKKNTTTPLVPQQRPVPAYDTRERRHAAADGH